MDGSVAETYETRFYPADGSSDWACSFLHGAVLVTVNIADRTSEGQINALELARAVAENLH